MRRFDLWLALRLLAGQRLRAATMFCGMLVSCFLADSFGLLGGWLLREMCGGGERARFDRTFGILALLAAVVAILVCFCACVLLWNLFSVTFLQRRGSLLRLWMLGGNRRGLAAVTAVEVVVLFCAAALPGALFARLAVRCVGVDLLPLWIDAAALSMVLAAAAVCAIRPLSDALREAAGRVGCVGQRERTQARRAGRVGQREKTCIGRVGERGQAPGRCAGRESREGKLYAGRTNRRKIRRHRDTCPRPGSFYRYMAKVYRASDRRRYRGITAAFAAAIVLFVPADYVIDTNLALHRAGLDMKYGVWYDAGPKDEAELQAALAACGRLAACGAAGDSVFYAALPVTTEVDSDILSGELRALLRENGWEEEPVFSASGTLLFLDTGNYAAYVRACGGGADCPAVLIDRYINRTAWKSDAKAWPRETALLSDAGAADVAGGSRKGGDIICGLSDAGAVDSAGSLHFLSLDEKRTPFCVTTGLITDKIPEGVDFDGNLSVILPLSSLPALQPAPGDFGFLRVCGKYEDAGASSFQELVECLGSDAPGALRNNREIFAEWYASMRGIHAAMRVICGLLFFAAVVHLSGMMIFLYAGQRRGLAVLWSLGQSPGELFRIFAALHVRGPLEGVLLGSGAACLACRALYGIYARVWQMPFALPLRQLGLIAAAGIFVSLAAVLVDGYLMRRQNFAGLLVLHCVIHR